VKQKRKTESTTPEGPPTIFTAGEILPNGKIIELVSSPPTGDLRLLTLDGKTPHISEEIDLWDRVYRPIQLHCSVRQAIRFPSGAAEFGSVCALAAETCELLCLWLGLPTPTAWSLTIWILTTWVFDALPNPPTLVVAGNIHQVIALFRLLQCMVRRGLTLADISRAALDSVLMSLHPTILLNRDDLPKRMGALLAASNHTGFHIPGRADTLLNIAGSRAIYAGIQLTTDSWTENTLRICLPPANSVPPPISTDTLHGVEVQLLPKLLMYRLRYSYDVQLCRLASPQVGSCSSELSHNLLACVLQEKDLGENLLPILESHEEDGRAQQARDPNYAIVEASWAPLHQGGMIRVSELTEKVNALLQSRGEFLEYSPEEIGWKLKNLGIGRRRGQKNNEVRFSRELSRHLHRLARSYGLNLPRHENCPDCASPEVVAAEEGM